VYGASTSRINLKPLPSNGKVWSLHCLRVIVDRFGDVVKATHKNEENFMKSSIASALVSMTILTSSAQAAEVINSADANSKLVNIGRIVKLVNLVEKEGMQINVMVVDRGGSTDVSPTQEAFLTLYSKGEMFSTDASFDLGPIYSLKSARRIAAGVFEIKVSEPGGGNGMPADATYTVDAKQATVDMRAVRCEDFDCEASSNFKASITVKKK
jgi:hypothetical protein